MTAFDRMATGAIGRSAAVAKVLQAFDALRGGVIGEVEIVDCVTCSDSPWFVGPYGFVLRNPRLLPFTPCKGKLGFFKIELAGETIS